MSELQDRIDDVRVLADAISSHDLPYPEISFDADGNFLFEWRVSWRTLITMWCRDHHISYSGLVDGVGGHARSEALETLPDGSLELLLAVAARMRVAEQSEGGKPDGTT